jgi:hypothetical protein
MTSRTADGHGDDLSRRGDDALLVRARSRWPVRLAWVVGLVLVAGVVAQVTTHPDDLPTSDKLVTASTPVGRSVYLGVFAAPADFGRTLEISGVKVFAESTVPVTITPHLCRGGSLGVTSEPGLFCAEVVDTEGATMGPGDEIVLEVTGDQPGVVDIERIRVAYRDGIRWATQFAGSPAVVTLLGPGAGSS